MNRAGSGYRLKKSPAYRPHVVPSREPVRPPSAKPAEGGIKAPPPTELPPSMQPETKKRPRFDP